MTKDQLRAALTDEVLRRADVAGHFALSQETEATDKMRAHYAAMREALLAALPPEGCVDSPYSSRICQRGTKGCEIDHAPEGPAVTADLEHLRRYVELMGPIHDEDCPGDDTCACSYAPMLAAVNRLCRPSLPLEGARAVGAGTGGVGSIGAPRGRAHW